MGVTASWSSGALTPGASGSVTAGFESTWKSTNSKSWERNQEKSIKEVKIIMDSVIELLYTNVRIRHGVSCLMGPKKQGFYSKINCS